MGRVLATAVVVLGLLAPASALAANQTVQIQDTGYSPTTVTVSVGEKVFFHYANTTLRGVEFDDTTGVSPTSCASDTALASPPDCPVTFSTAGRFRYHDPTCGTYDSCPAGFQGLVIVDGPPVARITGPTTAQRGQEVTFDGSTSSDPDGDSITTYQWSFDDGASGSGAQVGHAFTTAGHHVVTLTVSDSTGSGTTTFEIDITIPDRDGDGVNDDNDLCPDVAAATANGCPIVLPPPSLTISTIAASLLGKAGVIKSGVATVLTCSDTCTGVFSLLPITRLTGFSAVVTPLSTQTVTIKGAGSQVVTLKLSTRAKRALAKATNPKLRLQAVVTDSLARARTLTATIALKSVKGASKLPAIGISDQQARTFNDPHFQVLKLSYARLVAPWNAIFTEPERLDEWLQAARAHHVRPLITFHHRRGELCPGKPCTAPSAGQYKRAWRAFHRKYPWVKDISPWNEVNSATQPTGKKPQLAAMYYNIVRANCRGCRIVAADLLDTNNLRRYIVAFLKRAKGKPRLWGLHNYRDTNRFRERGTQTLLKYVKGQVWFTETGGIVRFETQGGKVALPKSEKRAKRAMDYMFKLARKYASRVKRVYVYQWRINFTGDRFDAGVVRDDGSPRPSFQVLSLNASVARKR